MRFVELGPRHIGGILPIERQAFNNPWTETDFSRIFQDGQTLALGLELAGEVVGYGIGQIDRSEYHLANLAINRTQRNKGYAGGLVEELLARAGDRGCTWCGLEVRISNAAAIGFYEKRGFRQVGIRPQYYVRPRENALIMRRELTTDPR